MTWMEVPFPWIRIALEGRKSPDKNMLMWSFGDEVSRRGFIDSRWMMVEWVRLTPPIYGHYVMN